MTAMGTSLIPLAFDFTRFGHDIADAYHRHIARPEKQPQFFLLISFLLTFTIVRLITHAIRAGRWRHVLHNVSGPGGVHVHHLVPGIILMLIFGYLGLSEPNASARAYHAVGFGIGAALTLDEFALWLNLKDVYWASQGRRSIDAVVIAATIFGLGITSHDFWTHAARSVGRLFGLH